MDEKLLKILRDQVAHEDAVASVALDLEGSIHTCSDVCSRPSCVDRREKAKLPHEFEPAGELFPEICRICRGEVDQAIHQNSPTS